MKPIKQILIIPTVAICLSGCEYKIDDLSFTDVKKTVYNTTVDLGSTDSIFYVCGTTRLTYNANLSNDKIKSAYFYLDNKPLTTNDQDKGCIIESTTSVGEHILTLELTTLTSSNSLACKLGVEMVTKQYSWKIVMLGSQPEKLKMLRIYPEDGRLRVEWEKSRMTGFTKYELTKHFVLKEGGRIIYTTAITNKNQNSYIDSTYVGGPIYYFLKLYVGGNYSVSDTLYFNDPLSIVTVKNSNSDCFIKWTKCKYPRNFGGYRLIGNVVNGNNETLVNSTNINDTSYALNLQLFPSRDYSFEYKQNLNAYGIMYWFSFSSGEKFQDFNKITKTMFNPYYIYTINKTSGCRYNPMNNEILPFEVPMLTPKFFKVSPFNSFIISELFKIETYNPFTNTFLDYLARNNLPGAYYSNVSMSNSPLSVLSLYNVGDYIYDFTKNILLYKLPINSRDPFFSKVSPNGKFLLLSPADNKLRIYKIDQNSSTELLTTSGTVTSYQFLPDTIKSEFLVTHNGKIEKWSCDELRCIISKDYGTNNLIDIDPISGTSLIVSYNYISVIDNKDLSLKKSFTYHSSFYPTDPPNYVEWINFSAYLDSTFYIQGLKFKLSF